MSYRRLRIRALSVCILGSVLIATAACSPDPELIAAKFTAANQAFAKRELEIARRLTNEILDLNPDHTNARILRGRTAYYEKDFAEAADDFREAWEHDPSSIDALLWLARAQSLQDASESDTGVKGPAAAIRTLETLVEKDPGNPAAWYLLGTLYESRTEPQMDRAIAAYRYGLVAGQNLGLIHLRLAEIYSAAKLPEQARPHLDAAIVFARLEGANADIQLRLAALRATLEN